jgi:hypothetical protein
MSRTYPAYSTRRRLYFGQPVTYFNIHGPAYQEARWRRLTRVAQNIMRSENREYLRPNEQRALISIIPTGSNYLQTWDPYQEQQEIINERAERESNEIAAQQHQRHLDIMSRRRENDYRVSIGLRPLARGEIRRLRRHAIHELAQQYGINRHWLRMNFPPWMFNQWIAYQQAEGSNAQTAQEFWQERFNINLQNYYDAMQDFE